MLFCFHARNYTSNDVMQRAREATNEITDTHDCQAPCNDDDDAQRKF